MRDQRRHRGLGDPWSMLVLRAVIRQPAPLPRAGPGLGGGDRVQHPQQPAQGARRRRACSPGRRRHGAAGGVLTDRSRHPDLPVVVAMGNWRLAHRDGIHELGACRAALRRRSRASLMRLVKRYGATRVTGSWRPSSRAAGEPGEDADATEPLGQLRGIELVRAVRLVHEGQLPRRTRAGGSGDGRFRPLHDSSRDPVLECSLAVSPPRA